MQKHSYFKNVTLVMSTLVLVGTSSHGVMSGICDENGVDNTRVF